MAAAAAAASDMAAALTKRVGELDADNHALRDTKYRLDAQVCWAM